MIVDHCSQMGTFHTNHNEDAFLVAPIDDHLYLLAVADGCSMGKESHFAATLVVKILRQAARNIGYRAFAEKQRPSLDTALHTCFRLLFEELHHIQARLFLEREELLTTVLVGILDKQQRRAELLAVGDGLIAHNGQLHEYDQDNRPDYLGYHLNTPFEEWYRTQTQRLSLHDIRDLSLCTDGIFSFQEIILHDEAPLTQAHILQQLLHDQTDFQLGNLQRSLRRLEQDYGLKNGDDCTIVRVLFP